MTFHILHDVSHLDMYTHSIIFYYYVLTMFGKSLEASRRPGDCLLELWLTRL